MRSRTKRVTLLCGAILTALCACGSSSPPGPGVPSFASGQNPCLATIDFGEVPIGLISSVTVEVMNTGGGILDLSVQDGGLDPEFDVMEPAGTDAGAPGPISPGHSETFTVTFQPYKVGAVQSTFTIGTDGLNPACPASGGSQSSLTVQMMGNGNQLSVLVKPDVVDFGNTLLNMPATKSVTLVNKASYPVTGIVATVIGGDTKLFTVDNCPSVLAGLASAQVNITYAPTALETRSLASVEFSGSDGENAIVNLFGEPVSPQP